MALHLSPVLQGTDYHPSQPLKPVLMEFKNQKPIYLQIADHICDRILLGEYGEDERLPSVREFAAEVEVNVNTVTRTFEYLQQNEVVASRRGLGVFVMPGARERVYAMRRAEFFKVQLPEVFALMDTLGISMEEVATQYDASRHAT